MVTHILCIHGISISGGLFEAVWGHLGSGGRTKLVKHTPKHIIIQINKKIILNLQIRFTQIYTLLWNAKTNSRIIILKLSFSKQNWQFRHEKGQNFEKISRWCPKILDKQDDFYFRWLWNSFIEIGKSTSTPLIFNHLKWNPSQWSRYIMKIHSPEVEICWWSNKKLRSG